MHFSNVVLGTFLLSLVVSVFGATEYDEAVPLELVKVLLGNPGFNEVRIYSDIPDGFPAFDLPSGIEVLGSVDQGVSQRVIMKTSMETDAASRSLEAELIRQGFIPFPLMGAEDMDRGFVSPRQIERPTILCRDDIGTVSLSASRTDDSTFVSLGNAQFSFGQPASTQPQTCEQRIDEQTQSYTMMQNMRNRGATNLRRYLPRMVVPEDDSPRFIAFGSGGSSSSSSNSLETEYDLNVDWPIAEVYQHIADQITEQGWVLDTESVGDISANGDWTYSPEPDVELVGNFNVLQTGEGSYQLKFRLIRLGEPPNRGAPYSPFRVQN
ncbi:MAG: hypothetical protein R3F50_03550 [Gammaproteobacteria bacterium]|jgi:hypothetical protein